MPGLRERTPGIVTKEGQKLFLRIFYAKPRSKGLLRFAPVKAHVLGQKDIKRDNFIGQNKIKREVLPKISVKIKLVFLIVF